MRNCSTWIVLFFTVVISRTYTVSAESIDELCCLCDECYFPASGRDNLNVDEFGTTCYEQLLSMTDPENSSTNGSSECTKQIALHRRRCCDSSFNPIDIAIAPTPAPVVSIPFGSEPYCDLCTDGRFPGSPKAVTAVLYIPGNPTCEVLYYMGQRGLIEDRLCNPMQDYLEEGCGCADAPTNQAPLAAAAAAALPPPSAPPTPVPAAVSNDANVEQLYYRKLPPPSSGRNKEAAKLSGGRVRGSGAVRERLLKGAQG
jgi:hypothetical protein